jgi:hypothetical protein
LPIKCDKDHKTFAINLRLVSPICSWTIIYPKSVFQITLYYIHLFVIRYRLDIEVEYGPAQTIFVFWDRECNELLGKTAAVQHAEMLQVSKFYQF